MTKKNLASCLLPLILVAGCEPGDGKAEFDAGVAAYELKDAAKAVKNFEASLKLAPRNVDALVYLARIGLETGDLPAAEKAIAAAAELEPQAVDVRLLTAQLAWYRQDYAAAEKTYAALANDAKLDAEVRSQAWSGLGIVNATIDRPHTARCAYLRAIRLDRRNAAAWYHLGRLYRDGLGYRDAALEQFEFYVRIEKDADVRVQKVQRTVIPALKEDIAAALTGRSGVAKRDSSAASDHIAKAEAAAQKGVWKTARQEYQAALDADPISYPAALGLAKAIEKCDQSKAGQEKAFEKYRLACELSPSAVSTYLHTGDLAAKLGRNALAAEIYSRAVAANPSSLEAIDGLIRALRKNGKSGDAQVYQTYRDSIPVRRRK